MSSGVPRRSLLACCAILGASAGCTSGDDGTGQGGQAAAATPQGLRRRAARDSTALLARYDATVSAHPALAGTLTAFRDTVAAHVTTLNESETAAPGAAGTTPEVPAEPDRALTALADAERHTADERLRDLAEAPPEFARLLASLAAAGAAQSYLLSEARP
ncbi:hypothetical protein [Streptomyces sp. NBC_01803]|uniref:hypothetical protein n=1 Tax=Streptomyces sp. NBC_01803 TaxID=2975946 RepID=UPI002DDC5A36|nr:hypothetical protein [Streptomyces sp. NBC_01803]WSA43936.1 hypothetical protein OIE51_06815 [Streptomyces sp. NBC_01803]